MAQTGTRTGIVRILRIFVVLVLGGAALLALAAAGWAARERARDPLGVIPHALGDVRIVADSAFAVVTTAGEDRVFRDLVMETADVGTIRVTTSWPAAPPDRPMPLVVVLAGLRTGRESLGYLDEHGPNVLVGYEYPYDRDTFYQTTRVAQVPAIRRAIHNVPSQVAHVAGYLAAHELVDAERTALLGFSFGAMFVPSVQRVAVEKGWPFDAMILAYGGADLAGLFDANLRIRSRVLRRGVANTAATLIHAMEPGHHLPHIPGRFLLIRGDQDPQIPTPLAERMAALTPEPKEIVVLDAGHMGPGDPELTARVVAVSQDWLIRQGVIDPLLPAPGS
jgi:pimeloyl-ACP methyl ester carboxylesterase